MIRVTADAKILMLPKKTAGTESYWYEVEIKGGECVGLIIETLRNDLHPLCPHCCVQMDEATFAKGAGLQPCPICDGLVLALRVIGGRRGIQWYSYPWPS